ncbi:MAG: cytoplasmic protein, partial [Proteobacteria bacterium]|nr:cytoplasmic protein [Pseudomonadota bacterium]
MADFRISALYLRRRRKVLIEAGDGADRLPRAYVATVLKNLEALGFTGSPRLIERLLTLSERDLAAAYKTIHTTLRKETGAHVAWTPMYPNFPRQVMEASDAELYVNALLHYLGDWVGARILPVYPIEDRPPLVEATALAVVDLGDAAELAAIARDLIGAATSISETDRDDLRVLVAYFSREASDLAAILPPEIPHKENLAFAASLLLAQPTLAGVAADVLLT